MSLAVCVAMAGRAAGAEPDAAAQARRILDAAGVAGGLVVHLGCGDGRLTAALHAGDAYLVHGLDADAADVAKARAHIRSLGLYGAVSAETLAGKELPYVDDLVNLVVVEDAGGVPMDEVMRVLAPGGAAYVRGPDGSWSRTVKPRPDDIDEWTHVLHDPGGNAVAADARIGPPRHLRWTAGPQHDRDHDALASLSAMTSSAGRLFYIFDEGATSLMHRPAAWRLIARDAFSGVLLWKREIPTWITHLHYFRSGPVQVTRRLVSVGDRVYATLGLDASVSALDAATGQTLRTFSGSENAEEIIVHDGVLLAAIGDPKLFNRLAPDVWNYWQHAVDRQPEAAKTIAAYRADTGEPLWRRTDENLGTLAPLSLAACGDRVFYLDNQRLWCLDLASGRPRWSAPFPTKGLFLRNYAPTVIAVKDAVLCLSADRLVAFAADDGKEMWKYDRGALGFASPADMFVVDGLVWVLPGTASVMDPSDKTTRGKEYEAAHYLGNGGTEFWGMDLRTGEVKKRLKKSDVWPGGHHHRCYRNKATENYLVCSRRGLEFVDLGGDNHVQNWWVRGECQYGVLPCNGLIYAPPDPCRCFNFVKVNGLLALCAGSSLDTAPAEEETRFQAGPAYAPGAERPAAAPPPAQAPKPAGALWSPPVSVPNSEEWPTFRHDPSRSGATPTAVSKDLARRWQADLGGRLTAPVMAAGRLYLAGPDRYTVYCLDAETGRTVWEFAAAGPVDSPPTLVDGLALFGSGDGCVYAVNAADGRLAWRYRIGPVDRRVGAEGRLESVWPVHGSVLVLDGVAYAAAGRSTYMDGGIYLVGLDVRSGTKRYEARLVADPASPGKDEWTGALADVLVSDGVFITMRQVQFDRSLRQQEPADVGTLFATDGLLEGSWFHRQVWHLGYPGKIASMGRNSVNGSANAQAGGATGKLIVFGDRRAYAVQSPYTVLKHTKSMWPPTHEGHLHQKYARFKPEWFPIGVWLCAQENAVRAAKVGKGTKNLQPDTAETWKQDLPLQVRGLVLAGDTLFAAGWEDAVAVVPPDGSPCPAPDRSVLWALSCDDGARVAEVALDAPPVFDGLIAARGRLYLVTTDGKVLCLGGK
ncbi:MAG: PQQ-binding-like beta-propeller repeat protein [Planctomycetes bacterium]|nr:PQQ-binding-like beta-propeller repeat protein [Planctomycetota bacterium]